jgi:DNA-binding transcriptional LysR family regulator
MIIDPRHLMQLTAIVNAGSYSEAAKRMGLTQPALSRNMRILEKTVGARVLERGRNGVTPTDIGLKLTTHGHTILSSLERAKGLAEAVSSGGAGELRVGCLQMVVNTVLAEPLEQFVTARPGVRVKAEIGASPLLQSRLRSGHLDLIIIRLTLAEISAGIEVEEGIGDELVVVCPKKHRLAKSKDITKENLSDSRWLVYSTLVYGADADRILPSLGVRMENVAVETDSQELLFRLLQEGKYLSLLPRRFVQGTRLEDFVAMVPLPERIQLRPIGIAYRKPFDLPPIASDFLQHLRRRIAR